MVKGFFLRLHFDLLPFLICGSVFQLNMYGINSFTCHSLESHSEEKKCLNLIDKEQHLNLPSTVKAEPKLLCQGL